VKSSVSAKDMAKIDISGNDNDGVNVEAAREQFLGGDDEPLKGFYEDDDDVELDMNKTKETG